MRDDRFDLSVAFRYPVAAFEVDFIEGHGGNEPTALRVCARLPGGKRGVRSAKSRMLESSPRDAADNKRHQIAKKASTLSIAFADWFVFFSNLVAGRNCARSRRRGEWMPGKRILRIRKTSDAMVLKRRGGGHGSRDRDLASYAIRNVTTQLFTR